MASLTWPSPRRRNAAVRCRTARRRARRRSFVDGRAIDLAPGQVREEESAQELSPILSTARGRSRPRRSASVFGVVERRRAVARPVTPLGVRPPLLTTATRRL